MGGSPPRAPMPLDRPHPFGDPLGHRLDRRRLPAPARAARRPASSPRAISGSEARTRDRTGDRCSYLSPFPSPSALSPPPLHSHAPPSGTRSAPPPLRAPPPCAARSPAICAAAARPSLREKPIARAEAAMLPHMPSVAKKRSSTALHQRLAPAATICRRPPWPRLITLNSRAPMQSNGPSAPDSRRFACASAASQSPVQHLVEPAPLVHQPRLDPDRLRRRPPVPGLPEHLQEPVPSAPPPAADAAAAPAPPPPCPPPIRPNKEHYRNKGFLSKEIVPNRIFVGFRNSRFRP